MPSLALYRNNDVHLEEPYRVTVPSHVDTLAELCAYLSGALPPLEDPSGRGYRFLYSLNGKPLWRVKDCLDVGTVVVSTGPGFLARRTIATSDDIAAAKDITPAHVAEQGEEVERSGGASQSPPALQPDHQGVQQPGAVGLGLSGSQPAPMSIQASASPFPGALDSDVAAYHMGLSGYTMPSVSAAEAASRRTDAAAAPPAAANGGGGDGPTPTREPPEAKRLFAPRGRSQESSGRPSFGQAPSATLAPPLAAGTGGGDSAPAYEWPTYGGKVHSPRASLGEPLTRGQVRVNGTWHPLPPCPQFVPAATVLHEDGFEEDEHLLTGLRTYAARKWKGFSGLSAISPTDVLGEDAVSTLVEKQLASSTGLPLRVVVSGPPCSGVSTTGALALRAAIRSCARDGALANHLLLVLDSELLFGGNTPSQHFAGVPSSSSQTSSAPTTPPLDISFAFQLVVRAVLDAVSVQRPALRAKGPLLAQLWDKLVTVNRTQPPPDFTAFPQVTAAVGHKVVAQWDAFAQRAFPILHAACRQGAGSSITREGAALRDAAMDIVFYGLPGEIACSLRFSGVLYAFDGLHILANSHKRRVERPTGDLGPVLKTVWRDAHCHAVVAWPSAAVPYEAIYLTPPSASVATLQIRTVGLVPAPSSSTFAASQYHGPPLPQLVDCQGKQYGVEVFLGCPGYLAPLAALARPLVGRSAPATAFSAYSQHRRREKAAEPFHLRVDDPEVGRLLYQLEQLVSFAK